MLKFAVGTIKQIRGGNLIMIKLGFVFAKLKYKLFGNKHEIMSEYYRKKGAKIGLNTVICSNLDYCDECCIEIGNNTVISTNVLFVTHDFSANKVIPGSASLYGKIIIGNNCFIGENSTILYGVEIPDNTVIAADSVLTRSPQEERTIWGGNPARKIGTWDRYIEKYKNKGIPGYEIRQAINNNDERLIRRNG